MCWTPANHNFLKSGGGIWSMLSVLELRLDEKSSVNRAFNTFLKTGHCSGWPAWIWSGSKRKGGTTLSPLVSPWVKDESFILVQLLFLALLPKGFWVAGGVEDLCVPESLRPCFAQWISGHWEGSFVLFIFYIYLLPFFSYRKTQGRSQISWRQARQSRRGKALCSLFLFCLKLWERKETGACNVPIFLFFPFLRLAASAREGGFAQENSVGGGGRTVVLPLLQHHIPKQFGASHIFHYQFLKKSGILFTEQPHGFCPVSLEMMECR